MRNHNARCIRHAAVADFNIVPVENFIFKKYIYIYIYIYIRVISYIYIYLFIYLFTMIIYLFTMIIYLLWAHIHSS